MYKFLNAVLSKYYYRKMHHYIHITFFKQILAENEHSMTIVIYCTFCILVYILRLDNHLGFSLASH